MKKECDIFICYRGNNNVLLPKLFAQYIEGINKDTSDKRNYGKVWFSDLETSGNYANEDELSSLISSAKYFVMFLFSGFTNGFFDERQQLNPKCITAKELKVAEIVRQKRKNTDNELVFISANINGESFSEQDVANIRRLFELNGILKDDTIDAFTQLNKNNFDLRQGDEQAFFDRLIVGITPKNYSNINNSQENVEVEWTADYARTWHSMKAPSRPSKSELEIYGEYFEIVKRKKSSTIVPNVLILGSTVEFRQLAYSKGFKVYVIDYSREYYDEISTEIDPKIKEEESFIYADWLQMASIFSQNKTIFDIIIGDLAIGNVAPNSISVFFSNIEQILSQEGYLLGKSVYKFSNYYKSHEQIIAKLKEIAEDERITKESLYGHVMFPLSIFASQPVPRETGCYKIDFQSLYGTVGNFVKDNKEIISPYDKFDIYLKDGTRFDTKMPKNFYVYSYKKIIETIEENNLYIDDTRYGTDVFKNEFPLFIIKKGKPQETIVSMESFIEQTPTDIRKEWDNSITSLFFIQSIILWDDDNDDETIFRYIEKLISESKIQIDKNYRYYLSEIPIDKMKNETAVLSKQAALSDSQEDDLQFNYTCGLLISILFKLKKVDNYLLRFVTRSLFAKLKNLSLWEPSQAPWMSARICICMFPMYQDWRNGVGLTKQDENYLKRLEKVVKQLADRRKTGEEFWASETGSHFDTSALCLEVLNLYKEYIPGLDSKIKEILDIHVNNNVIKETFIRFPIGDSLIQDVIDENTINGKSAYKKLCGRISWYSILYLLANENDKPIIATQLKAFCYKFRNSYISLLEKTHNKEIALVPQIIYSLKRTGIF
ncbi:MAG: hypothetical protein II896_01040 [Clostridia bacterium]|nr:hypothetical protein [Clostridia bacterium]